MTLDLFDFMTNPRCSQWEPLLKIKFLCHETHETSITKITVFSSLHQLHKITITHVIMKTKTSYTFQNSFKLRRYS